MPNRQIAQLTTRSLSVADVLATQDAVAAAEAGKNTLTEVKVAMSLNLLDNTSDANKPVSTAQGTAIGLKQDALVSGTNIKTINSTSILGSGDLVIDPKVYVAIISQSSTSAPTLGTLIKNGLIGVVSFNRQSQGVYRAVSTLTDFTSSKTIVLMLNGLNGTGTLGWSYVDANTVQFCSRDGSGTLTDSLIQGATLKIEIYT